MIRGFPHVECGKEARHSTTTRCAHYIAVGKVPAPDNMSPRENASSTAWTEAEIEHVRQLLPKIANGRKTRYQKLREKQKQGRSLCHKTKTKKEVTTTKPPKANG